MLSKQQLIYLSELYTGMMTEIFGVFSLNCDLYSSNVSNLIILLYLQNMSGEIFSLVNFKDFNSDLTLLKYSSELA